MPLKLDVAFRNMDPSDALNELIREKADKLDNVFNGITGCYVVLEALKRQGKRNQLEILIELRVPGPPIIVKHNSNQSESQNDMYATVRQAFKVANRQLKSYVDKNYNPTRVAPEARVETDPMSVADDDMSYAEDIEETPEA